MTTDSSGNRGKGTLPRSCYCYCRHRCCYYSEKKVLKTCNNYQLPSFFLGMLYICNSHQVKFNNEINNMNSYTHSHTQLNFFHDIIPRKSTFRPTFFQEVFFIQICYNIITDECMHAYNMYTYVFARHTFLYLSSMHFVMSVGNIFP